MRVQFNRNYCIFHQNLKVAINLTCDTISSLSQFTLLNLLTVFVIILSFDKSQVSGAQSTDELDNGFVVTEETHSWNYHHGMDNVSIHYIASSTDQVEIVQTRTQNTTGDVKFWGCYEYYTGVDWNNDSSYKEIYLERIDPYSCMTFCRGIPSPTYNISMIKGNLCMCIEWTHLLKTRIHEDYCNFDCPGSNTTLSSGDEGECGGNLAVSVYCLQHEQKCKTSNIETIGKVRGLLDAAFDDNYADHTLDENTEDFDSTAQICLHCKHESGCNRLSGFVAQQDYFPLNSPRACVANCKRIQSDGDRHNYTAVLLGWNFIPTSIGPEPLPICACQVNDPMTNEEFFEVVDTDECNTPCPGNNGTRCGARGDSSLKFYNVHYINLTHTGNERDENYNTPGNQSSTIDATSSTQSEATTTKSYEIPENSTTPLPNTTIAPTEVPPNVTEPVATTSTTFTPTTTTRTTTQPPKNDSCAIKCTGIGHYNETWHRCPGVQAFNCAEIGLIGIATWECLKNGTFKDTPNYSGCKTGWYEDLREEINNITESGIPLPKNKSETLLAQMKEHCAVTETNKRPYLGHEISSIAALMWRIVDITKVENQEDGIHILGKAMELPGLLLINSGPWNDIREDSVKATMGANLVSCMARSGFTLYNAVKTDNYNHNFPLSGLGSESENVVTFGTGSGSNAKQEKLTFPINPDSKSSYISLDKGWEAVVKEAAFVGISISRKHIQSIFSPKLISWTTKKSDTSTDRILNSNLISLQIGVNNYSSESRNLMGKKARVVLQHAIEAWGDKSQTVQRKLHAGETAKVAMGSAVCVFWDIPKGKWSNEGCRVVETTRTQTECECDHLTSFAVLMDPHKYVAKDFALEVLTLILCPLSVVCLLMSIIIFSAVGAIQCQRTTITKHLCVCLLIGLILVLFFVDRNYFHLPDAVCVGFGIVTHYIYLASFVWMAIEGVHLYKMVVYVFDSGRSPTTIYRILAYGIPVVIIGITCGTGYLLGHRPYGGDSFCWLEGQYVWSFIAPAALVVMGNMIILFVALKTAYQMKVATEHLQARQRTYKNWIRGSFSITVLLGITWLPGFFLSTNPMAAKVAGYIFVILNSSQGIFLFIFHCFMNEKVRMVAERNLSLPTWLSMPSSPSREVTQCGKKSENMKAYYSETMKSIKPDQDSLSRFPEAKTRRTQENSIPNPSQNANVGKTMSNDSNSSVFSIDYPDPKGREPELRESDSGLSTSSQKYLVRSKRRLSYYE